MKRLLLYLVLLTPAILSAQTKLVTDRDEDNNIVEKYEVLKAAPTIKDGGYKKYTYRNNELVCEGFYKNDQRDSTWKYYALPNQLSLEGQFHADQRTGVWTAYSRGMEQVKYDYTTKQLLFFKAPPADSLKEYRVINGADTIIAHLDRCPVYLDGPGNMIKLLVKNVVPRTANSDEIKGEVIIAFTLNKNGSRTNLKIKKGIGFGLDEQVFYAVANLDGQWLPGILNNKPVAVEYLVPVKFNIPAPHVIRVSRMIGQSVQ
ncbi:energy transducer TonB [Mucilaginibacter glaciei]|uniref:Energy transducer TonB n=1 Tax=Mucilaginibacter glaciei TaxID=2772109 RepID=A0A926NS03_9SPHI|nr:energy transducer TonB [Mucilaginibacter glaciei]MBD1393577.1 energy transducer TonB [Mucilaginibacter glaciei]